MEPDSGISPSQSSTKVEHSLFIPCFADMQNSAYFQINKLQMRSCRPINMATQHQLLLALR
ncbi:hypothetical protein RDABS01_033716 [Bienertia sinuspersici]